MQLSLSKAVIPKVWLQLMVGREGSSVGQWEVIRTFGLAGVYGVCKHQAEKQFFTAFSGW